MSIVNRTFLVLMTIALLSASVLAQANRLQDLVGSRGAGAENELESRGYVLTHSDDSDDDLYGYWWNRQAKKCVVVRVSDGRVRSVVDTTPPAATNARAATE